jgi:hypothetical protein
LQVAYQHSNAKRNDRAGSERNTAHFTWIGEALQHSRELLGIKEALNAKFQTAALRISHRFSHWVTGRMHAAPSTNGHLRFALVIGLGPWILSGQLLYQTPG